MSLRVLVSTTSFLDTPGPHHHELAKGGYEIVTARGPLNEAQMLELVGDGNQFDAFLCGDDAFTPAVLKAALPRVKVIAKYGIGVDKIDVPAARALGLAITNTPGVNHTTVAEHAFGLLLSLTRQIPAEDAIVKACQWKRLTGHELAGQTMGILGLGRIGKEVARRAMAFGMKVLAYDVYVGENHAFARELTEVFAGPLFAEFRPTMQFCEDDRVVLAEADVLSLHMNLTAENTHYLNAGRLESCRKGVYIVNTSRGGLIDQQAMADALRSGQVGGYGADVIEPEPVTADNPLLSAPNVVLTPHISSRTYESVVRQAMAAVTNLHAVLAGREPLAWVNKP